MYTCVNAESTVCFSFLSLPPIRDFEEDYFNSGVFAPFTVTQ